ncbi:MAG: hypothetical protein IPN51_03505 [Chloracidobacterium sp.]|nr:hypothetical protein [Chloracidobacterium sp.]
MSDLSFANIRLRKRSPAAAFSILLPKNIAERIRQQLTSTSPIWPNMKPERSDKLPYLSIIPEKGIDLADLRARTGLDESFLRKLLVELVVAGTVIDRPDDSFRQQPI